MSHLAWTAPAALVLTLNLAACNSVDEPGNEAVSPEIAFTEVTDEAGLGAFRYENAARGKKWLPETMGPGAAFLDYDGDGWEDLLLVAGRPWSGDGPSGPALQLYRNEGDGTFTPVTDQAGLSDLQAYGFGLSVADYDNDGDPDVYVTTLGQNLLLENRDGRFVDVAKEAGVRGEPVWSTASAFFDAQQDGRPDLLVGNYLRWSPEIDRACTIGDTVATYCSPAVYEGIPGRFYRNEGGGRFRDRTDAAGFSPMPGKTLGITDFDLHEDGDADLYWANDLERNLLYENDGTGRFTEVGQPAGVAAGPTGSARGSMGLDAGYPSDTSSLSIFVGNFSREMTGAFAHQRGILFRDRSGVSGIGEPSLRALTFGLALVDVDLDGDQDLFTANGHIFPRVAARTDGISYRQPVQLFLHRSDGRFELADLPPPLGTDSLVARGVALSDYDRDGDLDVLITENTGPVRLYRNDVRSRDDASPQNTAPHVLQVELRGAAGRPEAEGLNPPTNRDAIGSRVTVYADTLTVRRYVSGSSSYLSQNTRIAHFGLGTTPRVDSIRIRWHGGRVRRIKKPLDANQRLIVRENHPRIETAGLPYDAERITGKNRPASGQSTTEP